LHKGDSDFKSEILRGFSGHDDFDQTCFRVKNYASRKKKLSDADSTLAEDLSDLEKYLVESQELMSVRGKVHEFTILGEL